MSKENAREQHVATAGMRGIWGGVEPFGFDLACRRQHVYMLGKTGTGKSTLLRNLILQDIEAGLGVGLIDPHGDLAEDILDHIPPWRTDHVVYFNPADREYPVGLNLLIPTAAPDSRHLVTSGVVAAFKGIWRDSWGPRLEYLLYATVAALQECQNTSLLGLPRMLADEGYRRWVLKQVTDPVVHRFWTAEFAGYDRRFLAEVIAPVQNKVGQLLMAPPMRAILGQVRSGFDPRFMMDRSRIFIANLSKGQLGEDKANLLGALLVTQFEQAALSRADTPTSERVPFLLYVDEFQNFSTGSFTSVLSEARKYGLSLTLAHQYLGQLREDVQQAILGNVGTVVSFRTGETDGQILAREFGEDYTAQHFVGLANYEVRVRTLRGAGPAEPFVGQTEKPWALRTGRRDAVVRRSRERYAGRRHVVEQKINRWMEG
jgi:hypothetical protein